MNKDELLKEATKASDLLIAHRRYLHTHPGTAFDLTDTFDYVWQQLSDMGYQPQKCGKAGIVALAGGKKTGKVFLLRADMDALPIREDADVDFASKNGNMHACGHDLHTAMLLGAAKLLKTREHEIPGTIKLMFQPAEEFFEGAHDMINAGVLKNPPVDAALMLHVMAGMPFAPGTIISCDAGVSAPAADYFYIHVQGKGCHGSMPDHGVDPITVAAHIITGLQEIQARELALSEEAVITIGSIQGGNTANAIPDVVEMGGTIRTYDETTRSYIKERICAISSNIAAAFRASAKITFGSGCPTLLNAKELSVCAAQYVKDLLGEQHAFTAGQLSAMSDSKKASKSSGSEDFAYISHEVPSVMFALAAGQPDKGYCYPQHHPKVKFDESVLPIGSAVYAYTALRWLEEH